MEPVPYLLYHDDRLFVLDISTTQVRHLHDPEFGGISETVSSSSIDASSTWTLTTRRNCPGYPPTRMDHFESVGGLVDYVRKVEPITPRRSLNGSSPEPVPSYEEYLEWLDRNGLHGALETKLRHGGYFAPPEWREKLSWEAEQLAKYLGASRSTSLTTEASPNGDSLADDFVAGFAEVAKAKLAEARAALDLVDPAAPIYRKSAEEMVRVCEIIASGVTASSTESQLRSTIAALKEAMGGGLDASAFLTAQNVIEVVRKILGDETIDTGPVSRTFDEASMFLARSIAAEAKDRLRAAVSQSSNDVRSSFRLGMSVRNTLRSAGFTEAALGVPNLDDVWYEILKAALRIREV
jgi:hypothetical protein